MDEALPPQLGVETSTDQTEVLNNSTNEGKSQSTDIKWTELQFIATPEMREIQLDYGFPEVCEWRFSPSGRIGVSIVNRENIGVSPLVFLLDVYHHIWSGVTITGPPPMDTVLTYMINETNLIIVDSPRDGRYFEQHMYEVDIENRQATYIFTNIYMFLERRVPLDQDGDPFNNGRWIEDQWREDDDAPFPYIPITMNGIHYTCLIGMPNGINQIRTIYLINRHVWPEEHEEVLEFSVDLALNQKQLAPLEGLIGPDSANDVRFPYQGVYSGSGCSISFTPSVPLAPHLRRNGLDNRGPVFGSYLTIDLTKLKNIHEQHLPRTVIHEKRDFDAEQEAAMNLVVHPFAKVGGSVNFRSGLDGSCILHEPAESINEEKTKEMSYTVIGKKFARSVMSLSGSWLAMHPCGAMVQFHQENYTGEMKSRVVSSYSQQLFSIAASHLLFREDRPLGQIEGLHRIVFYPTPPINLDETAKKVVEDRQKALEAARNLEKLAKESQRKEDLAAKSEENQQKSNGTNEEQSVKVVDQPDVRQEPWNWLFFALELLSYLWPSIQH